MFLSALRLHSKDMDETRIAKLVAEQVKIALDDSMKKFKQDVVDEATSQATLSLKRSLNDNVEEVVKKTKVHHEFRRKFNKDQYEYNTKVEQALNNIESCLKDPEKAKEAIKEGKKLVKDRQKLVLIADREDDGWEVIKHYRSDVLAENSEDEKRIARSRRQAASDKKGRSEKRKQKPKKFYSNFKNKSDSNFYESRDKNSFSNFNKFNNDFRKCYICGREGHFHYTCPDRHGKQT